MYWRAGWAPTPKDEWTRVVVELIADESWIIDGNYNGTLDLRFPAADTIAARPPLIFRRPVRG
jgi:hypothetical protein